MVHLHTKYHMSSSCNSVEIAIKQKSKHGFCGVVQALFNIQHTYMFLIVPYFWKLNYHTRFQVCTLHDAYRISKMLITLWYKIIKYIGLHDDHTRVYCTL